MTWNYRGITIIQPLPGVERYRIDTTRGSLFFPSLASAKRYVKRKSYVLPEGRVWPFVRANTERPG